MRSLSYWLLREPSTSGMAWRARVFVDGRRVHECICPTRAQAKRAAMVALDTALKVLPS